MSFFLKAPKLDLYAYHLWQDLSQGKLANHNQLWEQIGKVGKISAIPHLEFLSTLLQDIPSSQETKRQTECELLLPRHHEKLGISDHILHFSHSDKLSGGLVTYRLHDTHIANLMWQMPDAVILIEQLTL